MQMKYIFGISFLIGLINIGYSQLQVTFSYTAGSGCTPVFVSFSGLANSGNITFWEWDFGDGVTANIQSPSHSYTIVGAYDVSLTVSNGVDTVNYTCMSCINVYPNPNASFTADYISPYIVQFNDQSTGINITNWYWDFGDMNTDTVQNPIHDYGTSGIYEAYLIVTNAYQCLSSIYIPNILSMLNIVENENNAIISLSKGEIIIKSSLKKISKISISNVKGELVMSFNTKDSNINTINIENLINGFYLLTIQFEDRTWQTKKVIITQQ